MDNNVTLLYDLVISLFMSHHLAHPLHRLATRTSHITGLSFSNHRRVAKQSRITRLKRDVHAVSIRLRHAVARLRTTGRRLLTSVSRGRQRSTTHHDFVTGMSRRLGAPLTLVDSCTRYLRRKMTSDRDHTCCYKIVRSRTGGAGRLLHHVAALVRLRDNNRPMRPVPFGLARLLRGVTSGCTPTLDGGTIALRLRIPASA